MPCEWVITDSYSGDVLRIDLLQPEVLPVYNIEPVVPISIYMSATCDIGLTVDAVSGIPIDKHCNVPIYGVQVPPTSYKQTMLTASPVKGFRNDNGTRLIQAPGIAACLPPDLVS